MVQIKRIYEPAAPGDGYRVLVDRLWPRGVSKERAQLDDWLKAVAPSDGLRQWYGHDPQKFPEFKKRYLAELAKNPATADLLALAKKHRTLTLLYAAKEPLNQAAVLQTFLADN